MKYKDVVVEGKKIHYFFSVCVGAERQDNEKSLDTQQE